MYRLIGPKLIILLPIIAIGATVVTISPNYVGATRVLSFTALMLGEAGLSFIPVLALYPKATPVQAALLAIIFFFTTFIICFSSFALHNLGLPGNIAFALKNNEFIINTHSLFAANLFSFLALIANFRLVYDEELTKTVISKQKEAPYRGKGKFLPLQKTLLKRPFESTSTVSSEPKKEKSTKKSLLEDPFEDKFTKPFEFEVESSTFNPETLPEESSGKLFAPKSKPQITPSDFFEEEETPFTHSIEPLATTKKDITLSPFSPSSIKDDLQAIFEQYSSLNAVKKLTTTKSEKLHEYQKRKLEQKQIESSEKPLEAQPEEEVLEGTYRQITEEEKLKELKEELKTQLEEELQQKLIKETERKEKEATSYKHEEKEEIIQSLKKEIIESLKEELKKEIIQSTTQSTSTTEVETKKEIPEEELEKYKEKLNSTKENLECDGLMLLDSEGIVILEDWIQKPVLQESVPASLAQLFKIVNKEMNKTNQGKLLHILLESKNGTLALANLGSKVLTIYTKGTGEIHCGHILKAVSIEEG